MAIVSLDDGIYTQKPTKVQTAKMNFVASNLSIEELAKQITDPIGRTWTPGYFSGKNRIGKEWVGQSVFALDIDNSHPNKGTLRFVDCLARAQAYGVEPAFAYSTFSATDQSEKYRVVFALPDAITDYRLRQALLLALMGLFPESDPACKDAARIFYGGKQIVYANYPALLDAVALIDGMCCFISDRDNRHAARRINDYCLKVGLKQKNGWPHVEHVDQLPADFGENAAGLIPQSIYIKTSAQNTNCSDGGIFHFTEQSNDDQQARSEKKYTQVESIKSERKLIRYVNWEALEQRCPVYRLFMSGNVDLDHTVKFGLATNLVCLEGGEKRFFEGLTKRAENDINKWRATINYINKRQYTPQLYATYYPEAEAIAGSQSLVEAAKLKRSMVRTIAQPPMKVLSEAEAEMEQAFNQILTADDGIYVLKAPTGIGKTRLYEQVSCALIAVPTHKLKNEIAERMRAAGSDIMTSPELPEGLDDDIVSQLEDLYAAGAFNEANRRMRKLDDPAIKEYMAQKDAVTKAHDRTVVTTHARLPYLHTNHDLIIIDEDIVPTLLPIGSTVLKDLEMVQACYVRRGFEHVLSADENECISMLAYIREATPNLVHAMPSFALDLKRLEQAVLRSAIKSNTLDFVTCTHFIKHTDGRIHFINRNELPYKKVIILSATASEVMYRALFGKRLTFIDIGLVEMKGTIKQDTRRMFSRSQLRENQGYHEEIAKLAGDTPIITFKEFQDCFGKSVVATFGATLGLNAFAGHDLVVVGTPSLNEETYLLYASALGIPLNPQETMKYIVVQRNGFEYHFVTYPNNEQLREIQLHLIEAELIQAIGRARALRNVCTVTVLSTLPIPGAEFLDEPHPPEVSPKRYDWRLAPYTPAHV